MFPDLKKIRREFWQEIAEIPEKEEWRRQDELASCLCQLGECICVRETFWTQLRKFFLKIW